jgi:hypothetical protein
MIGSKTFIQRQRIAKWYRNVTSVLPHSSGLKSQVPANRRKNQGPRTIFIATEMGARKLVNCTVIVRPVHARTQNFNAQARFRGSADEPHIPHERIPFPAKAVVLREGKQSVRRCVNQN